MAVQNNVFPQSGDADYAENFATWLGRGNISDFVETGLSITPDYANTTVDISQGKAFIIIDQDDTPSGETRLILDYVVTSTGVQDLAINGSAMNYIYLDSNVGTNDSPQFQVETDSSVADDGWLLIGEVDTNNNTTVERNRNPDADFDVLSARDTFEIPTYSSTADATAAESSIIYINGNGSQNAGIYVYDGSGYITAGVRDIKNLDGFTGLESLRSDIASNRPSAGTVDRIFIDETNKNIQRDTGSEWVELGRDPANIDVSDLGFSPVTDTELNNHVNNVTAHHNRPSAGAGLKEQNDNFNIEPADFAGDFLNDTLDELNVQIGSGLEDDGSGQIQLSETTVTVAGNGVSLGGSTSISYGDLSDTGTFPLTNSDLSNSSVTVAGNSVSLGGSTSINHSNLSSISSDDHHSKYTNSNAISAVDGEVDNAATSVASLDDQVATNSSDISSIQNDDTSIIETRTSDPSSPEDGRAWIRTDL